MADELAGPDRGSKPPSFDFDDDAISSLLDSFVETQTGPQAKHISHPPDPDDAGAQTAQRTVFQDPSRHEALPLVGRDRDTKARRVELLDALASRSVGSAKARLLTSAAELCEQLGDTEGALERYHAAQDSDARDVVVLRAIRRHAIRSGNWSLVVSALETEAALDLSPAERVAALKLLAQTQLTKLGDAAGAAQAAGRAAELAPDDFSSRVIAAGARLARGDRAGGAQALAESAERWPTAEAQPVLLSHAAELLEEADAGQSKALYERLLELRPGMLSARLGVARTATSLDDRDTAVASLREAALEAPASIARALRRTAAIGTTNQELRRELLAEAPSAASVWTLAQGAALDGDLRAALRALDAEASDTTAEVEGLFAALRARYHAELGDAFVDPDQAHPALQDYVEAWRNLVPSDAREEAPPREPVRLASALERERGFAVDPSVAGWALATAELAEASKRVGELLVAEGEQPSDRLVRHALLLADSDEARSAVRERLETETLGARAGAEYPPLAWRQEGPDAELDPESTALDPECPDPLLVEYHVESEGPHSEGAARLLLMAAAKLGSHRYLVRAAAAFLASGLPAEAAKALRAACAAAPDDALVRIRRKDAELRASEFARLADDAMQRARNAPDEHERLQAFAAMAEVDRFARGDMQSARLSLQSIAEARPDHIPTARALEWDAMRERDPERIQKSTRRLLDVLPEGSAERIARRRLSVELLRAEPDTVQNDLDRVLRSIDEPVEADPSLARQVLGAAYAKEQIDLALHALISLQASYSDDLERAALALEAANVLCQAGDTGRALEALNTAGGHPLALETEAALLRGAKRWDDAAKTYQDAATRAKDPRRAASLWREAASIFEEELLDTQEALANWAAAADADITYLDVYRRLASLYKSNGLRTDLVELTERRIEAGADNPTLITLLFDQAEQRTLDNDTEGAIAALDECLELDPQNFKALQQLVDIHRARADWQGATESLIRIARLKRSGDEQVWAFSQLAEVYHEHLDDLPRAEASLRRALELAPANIEALDRLAAVLIQQDKAREGARLLHVLVQRTSDEVRGRDYRIRLSRALETAGDSRPAETVLEELRIERPTDPDVILAFADYYKRQGATPAEAMHLNRAANDLREAIDARPNDEAAWATLVRVLGRRHGPDAASCSAGTAIALGHSPGLFEGSVGSHGESRGAAKLPLPSAIDNTIAPAGLPPTARRLFALCEHAFDKMLPFDSGAWRLRRPSGVHRELVDEVAAVAEALGVSEPRIRITHIAPTACMPIHGDPPTLVVGGKLHELTTADERFFLFARALKVAASHMAPALRARPEELDSALLALLLTHDASRSDGPTPQALQDLRKKLMKAVPRRWRDEVESLVLELRSHETFSTRLVPFAVSNLGDRAALILTGDTPAAVDALLKIAGHDVPRGHSGRLDAIATTPEAVALVRFAISDAHFEARAQAGVDG